MGIRKKLKIAKKYLVMILEWFTFVDKRTNVDTRLSNKIEATKENLELSQSEVQIAMRWFLLVPDVTKGKLDNAIYKELERVLYKTKAPFSVKRAGELTQNMYQLKVVLPQSQKLKTILLKMDEHQTLLTKIIAENY